MARVLIDASNLHHGGAVQVAASFITDVNRKRLETPNEYPWLGTADVLVSSRVAGELTDLTTVRVVNRPPVQAGLASRPRPSFDVSFTVFGPRYARGVSRRSIVGFADVTSLYPEIHRRITESTRRTVLRSRVSRLLASREQRLVVETAAMRDELASRWGLRYDAISVVPNTLSQQFISGLSALGEPLWNDNNPQPSDSLNLLYVTRPYPHKNLTFIGQLGRRLDQEGLALKVQVTIDKTEHLALDRDTQAYTTPIGIIPLGDLASKYRSADAAIFPSLLEAFSATPLEAMAVGTPLVASDRDFVRTVCGDYPIYIDPDDASRSAEIIVAAHRAMHFKPRHPQLHSWASGDRTDAYLELIDSELRKL